MTEGLESPRTDPKKRSSRLSRWVAIFAAALGAAAVIVIVYAYWTRPGWAGVADKTFWDYLELLIVPAALAIGVWWLTREQSKRDREAEDAQQRRDLKAENDRRERERNAQIAQRSRELEVENQRAQDAALQAYLDQMSRLLLDKEGRLRNSQVGDDVRAVARARTLTVLEALDSSRQRSLVRFLYEALLLGYRPDSNVESIISLGDANLTGCDLGGLSLPWIDLSGANLREANLTHTILQGSNLSNAKLDCATLQGADLHLANLSSAHLDGANLSHCGLRGADLRSTSLEDAILMEAELGPGMLIGWSISPRDQNFPSLLRDRLVDGMDIDKTPGSNYARTDLANARLNGANLEGANLSYAVARDIELREADLSRTDLRELTKYSDFPSPRDRVANETLVEQAKSLRGAILPNGQKYEEWLEDQEDRREDGVHNPT